MTKFRKSVIALISAIVLIASVCVGLALLPKPAGVSFADEPIVTATDADLAYADDDNTIVTGFSDSYTLPAKVNLVIPENVTRIAAGAFEARRQIVSVELPASLTAIGENAFRNCSGLIEVKDGTQSHITNGLGTTSTEQGCIAYYALNIYTLTSGESKIDATEGLIFCTDTRTTGTERNYLVGRYGTAAEIKLPAGEYDIYRYAFWNDAALQKVTFLSGAKISSVGDYAFLGCGNLQSVQLPATVTAIGECAFQSCAKLASLNLNELNALKTIGNSAFSDCGALTGPFTIPASVTEIGIFAFFNCAKIAELSFADSDEKDLDIKRGAFSGCGELTVLELPNRLKSLATEAFASCAKLNTAYLPAEVEYNKAAGDSSYFFGDNTLLIYKNKADCDAAKAVLTNHVNRMTSIVSIEYREIGRSSEIPSGIRLAGQPFQFVQGSDKSWGTATAAEALFATQEGYSQSVWYTGAACNDTEKATAETVTNLLSGSIANDKITLYARYTAAPNVSRTNLVYRENNVDGFTAKDFLTAGLDQKFSAELTGEGVRNGAVRDAGAYSIAVSLANPNLYGVWATPHTVSVSVTPLTVDPTTESWQVGGTEMFSDRLFVYKNDGGEIRYSSQMYVNGIGEYKLDSELSLTNSIARLTNATVTATLSANNAYTVKYAANQATEEGRYESTAVLTLNSNGNYQFPDITSVENAGRGVAVAKNQDGTVTVTKVWYLVKVGNALYSILPEEDEQNHKGTPYTISDFAYKSMDSVVIPRTENETEGLTFDFIKDEGATQITIGESVSIDLLGTYVNGSIPAGNYTLKITVPQDGDYAGYTDTYQFTVTPLRITETQLNAVKNKMADKVVRYLENTVQLYEYSDISSVFVTGMLQPNGGRAGVWKGSDYNHYFSDVFTITYNIEGMASNKYYTLSELAGDKNLIKPVNPGEYTVYYQLSANNYESLVDVTNDTARRGFTFRVNIYGVVEVPTIAPMVFNNTALTPYVPANELYTVENVSQISCGTHSVKLTLNNEHYRWIRGSDVSEASVREIEAPFEIVRADNAESTRLAMVQWAYGSYTDKVNSPVWSVAYTDESDESFYHFKLVDKKDETKSFELADFGKAPVGNYTLIATAKGYRQEDSATDGYNWNEFVKTLDVSVAKGTNTWAVTPNVMQWRYGGYDSKINQILAQASIADANNPVKFTVAYDDKGETAVSAVLKDFTATNGTVSEEVAADLARLKAGDYYLRAVVAETNSYSELDPAPLKFSVTQAENYWEEAPAIVTWIKGSYDPESNPISAVSHFAGEMRIVITAAGKDDVLYDSKEGIDNLKNAKVGIYELKATVAGTDDFSELSYTFTFRVFEKPGLPWWAIVLIVVGSLGVVALVFFILHQKGVLQLLTGKVIVAMRTKATVDATIAAVRANKLNEDAKQTAHKVRMKELREQRKMKMKEIALLPLEEQAAALDEMAQVTSKKSERLGKRADKIQQKAEAMRKKVAKQSPAAQEAVAEAPAESVPEQDSAVTDESPNAEE